MLQRPHWNNREDLESIVKRLVKVPSISGTLGEKRMAEELVEILGEIPYFQNHPNKIFTEDIPNDEFERVNVAALLEGKEKSNRKTVVLLSHYDVVGTADYGNLQPLAFDAEQLTEFLQTSKLPEEASKDLQTGDWLFGRGVMDMKAGLAIELGLLSELSQDEYFSGNILLLSVADEERNSAGMLAGVKLLMNLKKKYDLEYSLCLCTEPSFESFPGDESKYIYLGSAGKMLPLMFCVGKETHVGEPFAGVNAAWMAAAFTSNMELAEVFLERESDFSCPLPICLKIEDLKEQYNVQTPTHAYALYNIFTIKQTPEDVITKMKKLAEQTASELMDRMEKACISSGFLEYKQRINEAIPKVFTYSMLYDLGKQRFGESFEKELLTIIMNKDVNDYRELTISLAKKISDYFPDLAPFYLIMLSPPYYPNVSLKEDVNIKQLAKYIQKKAEGTGVEMKLQKYFMGLSDVSYCRLQDSENVIPTLAKELPLYGTRYHLPLETIAALDIPSLNIGPYGKDAHKRTERLELPFSLEVLPNLLNYAIKKVLI